MSEPSICTFKPGPFFATATTLQKTHIIAEWWKIPVDKVKATEGGYFNITLPYTPKNDTVTKRMFRGLKKTEHRNQVGQFTRCNYGGLPEEMRLATQEIEYEILEKIEALSNLESHDGYATDEEAQTCPPTPRKKRRV